MKKTKSNKLLILFKAIRKKVKLSTLFMLIITFSSSTFAWFIYATKVDSGITAHVKAWNVLFEVGEDEIVENIHFDVSDIYPGMETYTDSLFVKNKGEASAELSFEILSYTIFGNKYEVGNNGVLTSEELKQSLQNDYPFKTIITLSNNIIEPKKSESFSLVLSWPYESGDDDKDTLWGTKSYDYHVLNPDLPSISIELKVVAVQKNK